MPLFKIIDEAYPLNKTMIINRYLPMNELEYSFVR
jgi:hypothetical protein